MDSLNRLNSLNSENTAPHVNHAPALPSAANKAFVPYPFEPTRHNARVPALFDGMEAQVHPVVVVGGGPVGYCTALGLALQGVPVVLLEADDAVCTGSRAICISRRSLEIMQRLGALPGFLQHGLPWTGGRSFYRDQEVLNFSMPQDANQQLPPMVNLAQYRMEQILLDQAQARPDLIEIRWQTRLTGLSASETGVLLDVATPQGGYRLRTDWLVAADGGRSTVRESLGLKLQGTTYEGRYVIVDIHLKSSRPTERLAYFDPPCNPGSTVLVHKQPNDVWRIDYQLQDGEDPDAAIRPANVLPRVQSLLDMMGETGAWSPIWTGIYKANALTLPQYRHGRVLLAGDAAHLLPIFGVRGANSGIDDADNLAWKLALVVRGVARPTLLDSYSQERVAAAHENIRQGSKSTEFMAPPSPAFELMRKAVLGLAARHLGLQTLINPRQTTAIRYHDSPLNAWPQRSAVYGAGPAPGAVLPECPLTLADGSLSYLTKWLQGEFVALSFGPQPEPELQAWAQRWRNRSLPVVVRSVAASASASASAFAFATEFATDSATQPAPPTLTADGWDHTGHLWPLLGGQTGALILLRPDGHVLARWLDLSLDTVLAEADRALQLVLGARWPA